MLDFHLLVSLSSRSRTEVYPFIYQSACFRVSKEEGRRGREEREKVDHRHALPVSHEGKGRGSSSIEPTSFSIITGILGRTTSSFISLSVS